MKRLQTLLDESIVDPMPPFTSVDQLIARERRRRARHRAGVACGAAAAVLAIIGGVAFFGTPQAGAPPLTINPAAPSTSAEPSSSGFVRPSHGAETDAEISARLEAGFLARLSTVVPGASLDRVITPFLGADRVTLAEHLTFSGKGKILMPVARPESSCTCSGRPPAPPGRTHPESRRTRRSRSASSVVAPTPSC